MADMPRPAVDAHVHVVSPDEVRYPITPNQPGVTWFRECPCSTEDYIALMKENGVGQAVLVQAIGAYSTNNQYCVDAARAHPDLFRAVVFVDLDEPDPPGTLSRWADAGAIGVRMVAATTPQSRAPDDPLAVELCQAAAARGLGILATTLAPGLPRLPALLERLPHTPVAIDHCGFPDLTGGPPYRQARPLFELASFANVHLKVSTNALDQAVRAGGDPRDFVSELASAFGPERLQWGSDWSQTHDRTFAEIVAYARRSFAVLGEDERWPLGDAARQFWWGLAPAASSGAGSR